jgi:hypothetical protein
LQLCLCPNLQPLVRGVWTRQLPLAELILTSRIKQRPQLLFVVRNVERRVVSPGKLRSSM